MEHHAGAVYFLLTSNYMFLQVWHIPLTWLVGLLCGALLPFWVAFLLTHFVNIAGVACTCTVSKIFFSDLVQGTFLAKHLQKLDG